MKHRRYGFTLVELLAVLAIMAILVGVLIPAVNMVRKMAKNAAQKAQFASIDTALLAFRADYGDYPPSDWGPDENHCGAQKLAEALVGWDLLGFHPNSQWLADGSGTDLLGNNIYPVNPSVDNLNMRKGPYLELTTANAYRLGALYTRPSGTGSLAANPFVLCDAFRVKKTSIGAGPVVKAGSPILYYRANTTRRTMASNNRDENIYNVYDNLKLVDLPVMTDKTGLVMHPLSDDIDNLRDFINDPKITTITYWPHRPDSYILISAGADGLYGTSDDIRNF